MKVIGIVGKNGAGKSTFTNCIFDLVLNSEKIIKCVKFSDLLFETLKMWGLDPTRDNLQKLAQIMNRTFGGGTLADAVYNRVSKIKADLIILEGVRWTEDVQLLKKFTDNALVYVTADIEKRFQRMKERNEKPGEAEMTYEQF